MARAQRPPQGLENETLNSVLDGLVLLCSNTEHSAKGFVQNSVDVSTVGFVPFLQIQQ